jgi:class 3 adenylate cyclase/tetratricopeptide (TPR) repeat protein
MGGVAIVLFSDLVDSTALLARLGDDRMEEVRRAHVDDVTGVVSGAGGRVIKTLGDGVMASFESALGALHAAAGIQAAVERLDTTHDGIGVAARVGVAAGEPIPDGDDLHGMAVVIASRLSSSADTGEVLVQDLVQALVASRDGVTLEAARDYELKGVPNAVRASRLLWRELAPLDDDDADAGPDASDEGELAQTSTGDQTARATGGTRPAGIRLPPILAAYAEEPLIGRDREISMLQAAIAPRPGRRAVLVLGEPGIGKTRHAAAAAGEAHAQGATVVLARCPPEAVVPFEPWVRAIGELAQAGDEDWRETLASAAGPELSALIPELSEHAVFTDQAGAGQMAAAEGARYRLLSGIGSVLACAAGDTPLHVVLDDAHWCDPASAQALEHLLDSAPTEHLVLVVTARDREMGRRHPVSRVLSGLRRTGDLEELPLTGLDASGMAALVGARMGRSITPRLAERLRDRTSGNPFFAKELVRDLDEQGALRDSEALDAAPAPDAVADLVEERLGRLDPDTERLLAAVAAIGPSAPVTLAAKAAGLGQEEAERAVQEALSERLVDDVVATEPTVSFPHALVREALIAGTGDAARARLHLAIARALEQDPEAEPAELARHYGLSVELAGPEPAIAAYRAAAAVAAEAHDHEQAAAHMRSGISLLSDTDLAARAAALLELGEQELLAADLIKARQPFQEAVDAARAIGDAETLARAALGFAGGDIGFGWEVGTDDPMAVTLLQEGLGALGESDPRLALRMIFRLAYLSIFTDDDELMPDLVRRAKELEERLGDVEAQVLAGYTELLVDLVRCSEPTRVLDIVEGSLRLVELADRCDREDLRFRVVQWSTYCYYATGRIAECEKAIERAGEIAERLGSPRFSWEVDLNRGIRLMDRGERDAGRELVRRAGAVVRRLRPDIQMSVELLALLFAENVYDSKHATSRIVFEALEAVTPRGYIFAFAAFSAAETGDLDGAQRRISKLLAGDDLESLRRPDMHLPAAVCVLTHAVTLVGDHEAGVRLRPLLEPLRPYLISPAPTLAFAPIAEWQIGRLELLAGRPEAAVEELRKAVARTDAYEIVWSSAMYRVDLAIALHRSGEAAEAEATLAEAESLAERYGLGWATETAAKARAEIEGCEVSVAEPAGERTRPIRALAARGGRRALAAMVGDLNDAELERRYSEPRRQRSIMKGLARAFQPAHADGFSGALAFELEPLAIEPPLDAPWRWAIEVDSKGGRARLLEPAPLDAAVTVHIGLADMVRVAAGVQDPVAVMVAGRCSVEGDVAVAVRLEAMFGGQ